MDECPWDSALPEGAERALRALRPVAILLHGSRAVGRERPDSDWDLCVLVEGAGEPRWRSQQVGGVSLDLDIVPVTASDSLMIDHFGTSLRFAQVVADSDDRVGAAFVARARYLHERGRQVPASTLVEQAAHARRVARRMAGSTSQSDLFFFHLSTFFGLAVRYWFDREGRWPEPPYDALESIRAADHDYALLLSKLASDLSPHKKTQAAEEIAGRLLARR